MARTPKVTKAPQCRHGEEFLTRSIKDGLFNVECSNCGSEAGDGRDYEHARYALMKIEAEPVEA